MVSDLVAVFNAHWWMFYGCAGAAVGLACVASVVGYIIKVMREV